MEESKEEASLKKLRAAKKRFQIMEIAAFAVDSAVLLIFLFTYVFTDVRQILTQPLTISTLAWVAGGLSCLTGFAFALLGVIRKDLLLSKWGIVAGFLGGLICSCLSLAANIIASEAVWVQALTSLFCLVMLVLIIKEMGSLYDEKAVKALRVFSIIMLVAANVIIGVYLWVVLSWASSASNKDAINRTIEIVYLIVSLEFPSVCFYFYPLAIESDYALTDEKARIAALKEDK
jgi:hypothetical protein